MDNPVEPVDNRFGLMDSRLDALGAEMREGFTETQLGMAQITALLTIIAGRDTSD